MNLTITQAHNEYRLQGSINFLALGPDNAWCEIYDGDQPAAGGAATNLLVKVTLVEPLGSLASGALIITPTPEAIILRSGIGTWARFFNGNGDAAWDCDVSAINGNGAIKLATQDPDIAQLYAGGTTRIASGTLV